VEPPFSGKNASGSVSAHSASCRHPSAAAEIASHVDGGIGSGAGAADESVSRVKNGREKEDTGSSSKRLCRTPEVTD
jgi:hypothetical protein